MPNRPFLQQKAQTPCWARSIIGLFTLLAATTALVGLERAAPTLFGVLSVEELLGLMFSSVVTFAFLFVGLPATPEHAADHVEEVLPGVIFSTVDDAGLVQFLPLYVEFGRSLTLKALGGIVVLLVCVLPDATSCCSAPRSTGGTAAAATRPPKRVWGWRRPRPQRQQMRPARTLRVYAACGRVVVMRTYARPLGPWTTLEWTLPPTCLQTLRPPGMRTGHQSAGSSVVPRMPPTGAGARRSARAAGRPAAEGVRRAVVGLGLVVAGGSRWRRR